MGFRAMEEQRLTLDVTIFNILINAFVKRRQPDRALALFESMRERQLAPDVVTINALIRACEKTDQSTRALVFFEVMQDQQLTPDGVTYNSLIKCFQRSRQPERAMEILESMQRRSLTPTSGTYHALLSGCDNEGGHLPAKWDITNYTALYEMSYGLMIRDCEERSMPERALALFDEMQERRLTPSSS